MAQVAAVMGAKRTADLIPMCHPLMLTRIDVAFELRQEEVGLRRRWQLTAAPASKWSADRGGNGRTDDLRHAEGGRPWNDDRGDSAGGEGGGRSGRWSRDAAIAGCHPRDEVD